MLPKPTLRTTLLWFSTLACAASLSACPNLSDESSDGGSTSANGDGGRGDDIKDAGASREDSGVTAGRGGAGDHAGAGGTAGSMTQAGSGGDGDSDTDAGVEPGERCGTRGAGECESDQFCNFEPDADCGATDRGGVCEVMPEVCDTNFAPVCGCDSRTYSNACDAHAAGVSVKHEGTCTRDECEDSGGHVLSGADAQCRANEDMFSLGETPTPQVCCVPRPSEGMTCGGIAALECGLDEFCNYELGQGCDGTVADAAGKCEVKPTVCTSDYTPVCGCDHKTYGNLCGAHAAGASVLHDGACTVSDCEAIGGRVAVGTGPAAMCENDEVEHTSIVNDNGSIAIEGMLCCLKK